MLELGLLGDVVIVSLMLSGTKTFCLNTIEINNAFTETITLLPIFGKVSATDSYLSDQNSE